VPKIDLNKYNDDAPRMVPVRQGTKRPSREDSKRTRNDYGAERELKDLLRTMAEALDEEDV
jgi:hypothetical protein